MAGVTHGVPVPIAAVNPSAEEYHVTVPPVEPTDVSVTVVGPQPVAGEAEAVPTYSGCTVRVLVPTGVPGSAAVVGTPTCAATAGGFAAAVC